MLQKFNITTYAVALCLFAFMLFTAAPVFADPQGDFEECQSIKPNGVDFDLMKDKKNCFKDIAEELLVAIGEINHRSEMIDTNDITDFGVVRRCKDFKSGVYETTEGGIALHIGVEYDDPYILEIAENCEN